MTISPHSPAVFILTLGILVQFDPPGNFYLTRLGPWACEGANQEGIREEALQRESGVWDLLWKGRSPTPVFLGSPAFGFSLSLC